MNSLAFVTREQLEAELARADAEIAARAEQRRADLEARCRDSFAAFFRAGWHVIEGTPLLWSWHLDAQCETAQAFAEGWIVAHGHGTPAMLERQRAHWRRHGREMIDGELLVDHLVCNGGPSTAKSRIWMVFLQAWVWLHAPAAVFACTSGTGKNVTRDSGYAEQLVKSSWYRETFRVPWRVGVDATGKVIDSTERWVNTAGGERMSMVWCSDWSGVHADFLLGDDPNDAKKVWSTAERDEVRDTYDKAMGNRLKFGSVTMILQQHVHPEDLTMVLKTRGVPDGDKAALARAKRCGTWSIDHRKRWAAFSMPVEYNPAKPSATPWGWVDPRTEIGEVLFSAQWTPAVIAAEVERLGPAGWAAQGNQDPETGAGGDVDRAWFGFCLIDGDPLPFRPRPKGCAPRDGDRARPPVVIRRLSSGRLDLDWLEIHVDPKNGSQRKRSSRVGLVLVGGKGNQRFILDDRTDRLGFLGTLDAIREMIIDWAPHGLTAVVVEFKAQGEAVIGTITREIAQGAIRDRDGRPVVIAVEDAEGGSTPFDQRFHAALPSFRSGMVHVLDGASWAEEHIEETCAVPNGAFDDRPDAVCQAINRHAARRADTRGAGLISIADYASRNPGAIAGVV